MGLRSADEVPRRIADLGSHDAYALLEIPSDASAERIQQAYRRAMARVHPDVGGTPEQAKLVNCAFEVLSRYRDEYDAARRSRDAAAGGDGFRHGPDDLRDLEDLEDLDSDLAGPVVEPIVVEPIGGPGMPFAEGEPPSAPGPSRWGGAARWRTPLTAIGLAVMAAGLLLTARWPGAPGPGPASGGTGAGVAGTSVSVSAAPASGTGNGPWVASDLAGSGVRTGDGSGAGAALASAASSAAASPATGGGAAGGTGGAGGGAGGGHQCLVRADSSLWCWGSGRHGELGNGATADAALPVRVTAPADQWVTASWGGASTCGLRVDGSLWCWGDNSHGQLGDGTTTARSAPVTIGAGSAWIAVATGTHTCGIRSDHTLWCWGAGDHGELGEVTGSRASPAQVGSERTWAAVTVTEGRTCAVRQNGTSQCWGVTA